MGALSVLVSVLGVSNSNIFGLDLILHRLVFDTWHYLCSKSLFTVWSRVGSKLSAVSQLFTGFLNLIF